MAKMHGFGMILKSAGPDDVPFSRGTSVANNGGEIEIIWDKNGEEIGRHQEPVCSWLWQPKYKKKDPKRGTEERWLTQGSIVNKYNKVRQFCSLFTAATTSVLWLAATVMSKIFSHGCESRLVAKN